VIGRRPGACHAQQADVVIGLDVFQEHPNLRVQAAKMNNQ
jgi:hypothetical protein